MKRILIFTMMLTAAMATIAQTLNIQVGQVIYQVPADSAGKMPFANASTLTVMQKAYDISSITRIYIDNSEVTDNLIIVDFNNDNTTVKVPGNIARKLTVSANKGHVAIVQDATVDEEITYQLQGQAENGSFYMNGELKASLLLNGLTLNNPDSAAINIRDGKRISVELASGTTNTLTDGANGSQKACFAVKGHTEFKGGGTLNITGNTAHAFWGKEYVELKKTVGAINILGAVGDGFNINQYFLQKGGAVTITGVGDDGLQVSYETDDDDAIVDDAENTGNIDIQGGSLDITTTGNGVKAIKAANDFGMTAGTVTINQTGSLKVDADDIDYAVGVKAGHNIVINGGNVNITNTADGGKGLSADGNITIDQSSATTVIDIKANGSGGVAEGVNTGGGDDKSYRVYINYSGSSSGSGPGGSGTNLWQKFYLYKSDGTYVGQLTNSVTKQSGYSSYTFYYYDFQGPSSDTYYFKSDNYTSGGGWGGGTTYAIQSQTFSVPNGSDVYYQMSRDGYTTSGTTRTFTLNNVTSTYSGSSDSGEDSGTSYNASGIKADSAVTINAGTITIANSGDMSKSIKSKQTVTINGGTLTLSPSGAIRVINNDASYSTGIKALDCVINGGTIGITVGGQCGKGISVGNNTTSNGTLTVNGGSLNVQLTSGATGYGSASAGNRHTAKGLKSDGHMMLYGGDITVVTVTAGAKAIKVNGNYIQGTTSGTGPTVTLSTTGARYGTSGSSGGMGGKTTGQGGAAKGVKAEGTCTLNAGQTVITTQQDGGEGLEGKSGVTINGGKHYFKCYDDCVSSAGLVVFNDGMTVAYSFGNDAIDSNAGRSGAITIGNGAVLAYSSKGGAEEGLDCDNNSYIRITGNGYAISGGGSQGGGGWGGSSSSIGSSVQGYYLSTSNLSYSAGRYYSILTSNNTPLVTYSVEAGFSSSLSLFTAKGMTSGSSYTIKYSTSAPTGATDSWHGLYLGGSTSGTLSSFTSFSAK